MTLLERVTPSSAIRSDASRTSNSGPRKRRSAAWTAGDFLFGHHPIYSSGQHGLEDGNRGVMPSLDTALRPMIERCGVHVYFAGHDHHQEHVRADGFEQIVQGAGGQSLRRIHIDELGAAAQGRTGFAEVGFALVTVDPESIRITFYRPDDANGYEEIYNWWSTLDAYGGRVLDAPAPPNRYGFTRSSVPGR